jgi:type IV pilus assembly protein PilM
MLWNRKRPMVGLDIGSSSIKVVKVENEGGNYHLKDFGSADLLPEAIVDGEVMDRQLVVETIQNLFESKHFKVRDVAAAVSGRAVIVKKIQMDRMTPEDAREAISWEAEQHVPYDINEVCLDFQILDGSSDPKRMEVLLVAAKREMLMSHASMIRDAGLNPLVLDVESFAVQNAISLNYDFAPEEVVALVNVGSELTNINIIKDGVPLYTQDLSVGGIHFVEAVQRQFNLSHAEAEAAVHGDEQAEFDLDQVIREVGEELATGIDRSVMYLQNTEASEDLSRILLTGGGVRIPGLEEFLRQRHQAAVEVADPLRRVRFDPALFGDKKPEEVAPSLTVGLGLALRKVSDR